MNPSTEEAAVIETPVLSSAVMQRFQGGCGWMGGVPGAGPLGANGGEDGGENDSAADEANASVLFLSSRSSSVIPPPPPPTFFFCLGLFTLLASLPLLPRSCPGLTSRHLFSPRLASLCTHGAGEEIPPTGLFFLLVHFEKACWRF